MAGRSATRLQIRRAQLGDEQKPLQNPLHDYGELARWIERLAAGMDEFNPGDGRQARAWADRILSQIGD